MTSADAEAEAILERAATWLWSQRDKDAGWGNDTHRVLLVLRLVNLSRDDVTPPAPSLELQLTAKQMELEIVLLLWRFLETQSSFFFKKNVFSSFSSLSRKKISHFIILILLYFIILFILYLEICKYRLTSMFGKATTKLFFLTFF